LNAKSVTNNHQSTHPKTERSAEPVSKKKTLEELKRIGSYRPTRHARRAGALNFEPHSGTAPKFLTTLARREWRRIAPQLVSEGAFARVDEMLLAQYCEAVAGWLRTLAHITKHGDTMLALARTKTGSTSKFYRNPSIDANNRYAAQMHEGAKKFGLTPRDREAITGQEELNPDEGQSDDFS
jgi:P27 family predicted phage terminase small subunit